METQAAAELFIRFIREYAPIPRQANMYHEEIEERAEQMGVPLLEFVHPATERIKEHFSPLTNKLTNLVLTGTAGDGKTRLLYDFWRELSGDDSILISRPKHAKLEATIGGKLVHFHFIFDLSKCLPEKGQPWDSNQVTLLNDWLSSLLRRNSTIFVVAANDGKLLQALRSLKAEQADSPVSEVEAEIEDMLAEKRANSTTLALALLDLSGMSSAQTFDVAYDALLRRPEWRCFAECETDPLFGSNSSLRTNWEILSRSEFRGRLRTLIELCDVNGFHISVRDLLALLINALLGHPKAADRVLTVSEARTLAIPGESVRGSIYRNIFGENLKDERRQDFLVFSYLNYFRVGHETSNSIDELILFGRDLPALQVSYARLINDTTGRDALNPAFENLRREYLEAEEFDDVKREEFLSELAQQRRRLFFRITDDDAAGLDPWHLTIFQFAGKFLSTVLHPLKNGHSASQSTIESIVRGLNRVWSGMLFDEGNKLFLTSGLDFTAARISRLSLHTVSVSENLSGEKIEIILNNRQQPVLQVNLLGGPPVSYRLDLMRFEFLIRVAEGALPNSFSRECYEDVINFKTQLLARVQSLMAKKDMRYFKYLSTDSDGRPTEETINL